MKHINYYHLLVLFIVLMQAGCQSDEGNKAPTAIKTVKASVKTKSHVLDYSGELEPINQSVVLAPVDGVVSKRLFKFGDKVKEGQPLIQIESTNTQKSFDDNLTNFLKAKSAMMAAQEKSEGSEKLWKAGILARNSYDSDKSSYYASKIAYTQAKSKFQAFLEKSQIDGSDELLTLSLSDVDKVNAILNHNYETLMIKSPADGVMLLPPKVNIAKAVNVGSRIKANDVLALIGDMTGFHVPISVAEVDIDKLKIGMKVSISSVSLRGKSIEGKVAQIVSQAIPGSGNKGVSQYSVLVEANNIPKKLAPFIRVGMNADVHMVLDKSRALVIPIAALHRDYRSVWVNKKEHDACVKQEVSLGQPFSREVGILKGLRDGDEICLS